jgi:TatD DNase family protein
MSLIDTHCHLNLWENHGDPTLAIAEAHEAGVDRLIVVGIDRKSSERAVELAEQHWGIYAVVGVHPNSAAGFVSSDLDWVAELVEHPKVLAIGEIGLDYHWDLASKPEQMACLMAQLELASELAVPVVFHCRKAYEDLLTCLEARPTHPYLLHCFSGTVEDAQRAMKLDAYFGVDGPITYKNSSLPSVVAALPLDRLVVETDSPYLAPDPFRGKPNQPKHVVLVNRKLAEVKGVTEIEMADWTTRNAERFFRLPVA